MRMTTKKMFRIVAAWAILGAILACGGSDDEENPPPAPTPVIAPPSVPPPNPTPTANPAAPAAPTQDISLSTGFIPDPQTARGTAGGPTQATTLNSDCRGWIPTTPQHRLTLQTAFSNLRIIGHSAQDTTLVVRGPDGSYRCNDDGEMLNPIVEGAFPAGTYEIYVGMWGSSGTAPYVIGFTELSSTTAAQLGF